MRVVKANMKKDVVPKHCAEIDEIDPATNDADKIIVIKKDAAVEIKKNDVFDCDVGGSKKEEEAVNELDMEV